MAEMDGQYYILLKGKMAEKRDKGITGFSKGKKFVSLLEGEILISAREKDQPKENTLIKLNSIERPSVILECYTTDVQRIDQDEAKLLLPLCSLSERLKVFRERKRLTNGKKMGVGSKVWVIILVNRNKKIFQGIIRYKGPLPGILGTMFGVELLESVGKGSTDGSFKGRYYFKCAKNGGVFVSLEKLVLWTKDLRTSGKVNGDKFEGLSKDKNKTKEINSYTKSTIENSLDQNIEHNLYDAVWVYIDDKPQRGIIQFIGRPPGEKNILVGIKMHKKCGKGDGEYYGKQLFECEKDHALFTQISNVISKEKFSAMFLEPQKSQTFNSKEDCSSTSGSTCNDIVQIVSKFSEVSETEVIKQQEEIFRKAKEEALAQRLKKEPKRGIDQRVKPKRDNYENLVDESYPSWTFVNYKSEEVEMDWTSSNGTTSNKPRTPLDEVWKTESTNSHGMSDGKRRVTQSADGSSCYNNPSRTEHRAHVTARSDSMSRKKQDVTKTTGNWTAIRPQSMKKTEEDDLSYLNKNCLTLTHPITKGHERFACNLVRQLASHKAPVRITLDAPEKEDMSTISKGQVETENNGCQFTLEVSPQTTVKQLKHMAEQKRCWKENQQRQQNYQELLKVFDKSLIENQEQFECPICFVDTDRGEGVVLRECLHNFCRECLMEHIRHNTEPEVQCPFKNDDFACCEVITHQEIQQLLSEEDFQKYLNRSLAIAESQASNSFHCQTPNCHGWCIYDDEVNDFDCPVCDEKNCLTCKALHDPLDCKEYQDDLKRMAVNDEAARKTQEHLEEMLKNKDGMNCPSCGIILIKKDGCDWMKCTMCKTEICWAVRGPRWGPGGPGDTSGGCKCNVNNNKCHPECRYCH